MREDCGINCAQPIPDITIDFGGLHLVNLIQCEPEIGGMLPITQDDSWSEVVYHLCLPVKVPTIPNGLSGDPVININTKRGLFKRFTNSSVYRSEILRFSVSFGETPDPGVGPL